jgi:hypothetical protein
MRAKTLRNLNVWLLVSLLYMSNARRISTELANQNWAIRVDRDSE